MEQARAVAGVLWALGGLLLAVGAGMTWSYGTALLVLGGWCLVTALACASAAGKGRRT
jgi:hypothetical protein